MAINESIPLQVQAPSIMGAAIGGLQAGQQFAANRQQMEQQKQAQNIQAIKYAHDTALQLKMAPVDQRQNIVNQALPQLKKLGIDTDGMDFADHLDDASLDNFIAATKPYTVVPGQRFASASPTGSESIVDKNGTAYSQIKVFDPATNKVSLIETALGPTSSLTNRMGETSETAMERAIRLKKEQEDYAAKKALEVAGGQAEIKLGTEKKMIPVVGGQETSKEVGKDVAALESDIINQGISAAENLPRLEEALDLMKKVETGGFNRWAKSIADKLGMDTTDSSLVQSAFSNNILSLLQAQKGVQTKSDQELIEKTGPNFDFSDKANIELLKRVVSRSKILKKRGIEIAQKRPEYSTALDTMNRDYSYKPETVAPQPKAPATKPPKEFNWGDLP